MWNTNELKHCIREEHIGAKGAYSAVHACFDAGLKQNEIYYMWRQLTYQDIEKYKEIKHISLDVALKKMYSMVTKASMKRPDNKKVLSKVYPWQPKTTLTDNEAEERLIEVYVELGYSDEVARTRAANAREAAKHTTRICNM